MNKYIFIAFCALAAIEALGESWLYDAKVVKTARHASAAVLKLNQLSSLSEKCNNSDYQSADLYRELALSTKDKIRVDLAWFEQVMAKEQGLAKRVKDYVSELDCSQVEGSFDKLFSEYDNAKFELDTAYPLDIPFKSNAQSRSDYVKALQANIVNWLEESEVVVMGTITDIPNMPNSLKKYVTGEHSAAFRAEEIWKGQIKAFIPLKDVTASPLSLKPFVAYGNYEFEDKKYENVQLSQFTTLKVLLFLAPETGNLSHWVSSQSEFFPYYTKALTNYKRENVIRKPSDTYKKGIDDF